MESEDYSFFKNLDWLLENNVEDLGSELTFSTEIQEFGVTETRELIPNGKNVQVRVRQSPLSSALFVIAKFGFHHMKFFPIF